MRELTIDELGIVSGGGDPNYKECIYGAAGGGGPGVYPNYVTCNPPPPPPPNNQVSAGNPGGIMGLLGGGGHPA